MDVQAAKRARVRSSLGQELAVWYVMTERGYFYLVERGDEGEIFRAARSPVGGSNDRTCRSPLEAALRFLELYPAKGQAAQQETAAKDADPIALCAKCGAPGCAERTATLS